jgi:hypothetical protein
MRRMEELPVPERLVIWAARTWVAALKWDRDAGPALRRTFAATCGDDVAEAAAEAVDRMMRWTGTGALRPLGVNCACRPAVSADEQALLAAVALLQEGRDVEARRLMTNILDLEPCAAAKASASAQGLAVLLDEAGLRLALPSVSAPALH